MSSQKPQLPADHTKKAAQLAEIVVSPQSNPSMVAGHLTSGPSSAREGTSPLIAVLQAEGKDGYLV